MNQTQVKSPWPDWRIIKSLGGGSFGAVYEIQRGLLDGSIEKAAMKIISIPKDPSEAQELLNSYDRESVNRRYRDDLKDIVREYSLMAQMKGNVNIVHCEDMKHEPKTDGIGYNLYIKMELLTPLSKVLTNPISEEQVVKVGMDLCNALAACRKKNIIHRDIKPANIMVSTDGHYKLGDFGIAKTSDRTAGGTFAGTPNFMAPEIYHNKPYGAAVDIYSLGMVLYWMLNERLGPFLPLPPTMPKASQIEEAKQRRMNGEALPAPKHGSRALKQIVLKACAPRTEDRYNSPEAMYDALAAICGESSREESSSHRAQSGAASSKGAVNKDDASMGNSWEDEYNQSQGSYWSRKSDSVQGGTVGTDYSNKSSPNIVYGPYDIKANLTITAQEAAQGCRKEISIGQKTISVHVPAGTSNGQILRLRGLGKTDPTTGARGTLYIQIKIDQSTADFWKENNGTPSAKQELDKGPKKKEDKNSTKKSTINILSIVAWFIWIIIFVVSITVMGPVGACVAGVMLLICAWAEYLIRSEKNTKLGEVLVFVAPLLLGLPLAMFGGSPIGAVIIILIAGFCSINGQK